MLAIFINDIMVINSCFKMTDYKYFDKMMNLIHVMYIKKIKIGSILFSDFGHFCIATFGHLVTINHC